MKLCVSFAIKKMKALITYSSNVIIVAWFGIANLKVAAEITPCKLGQAMWRGSLMSGRLSTLKTPYVELA